MFFSCKFGRYPSCKCPSQWKCHGKKYLVHHMSTCCYISIYDAHFTKFYHLCGIRRNLLLFLVWLMETQQIGLEAFYIQLVNKQMKLFWTSCLASVLQGLFSYSSIPEFGLGLTFWIYLQLSTFLPTVWQLFLVPDL